MTWKNIIKSPKSTAIGLIVLLSLFLMLTKHITVEQMITIWGGLVGLIALFKNDNDLNSNTTGN